MTRASRTSGCLSRTGTSCATCRAATRWRPRRGNPDGLREADLLDVPAVVRAADVPRRGLRARQLPRRHAAGGEDPLAAFEGGPVAGRGAAGEGAGVRVA